LVVFTAVVALGLIVELLWDHKREIIALFKELIWLGYLTKASRRTCWKLSGVLLVTIGVTGELWFEHEGRTSETELRDFNNRIVLALQQDVADTGLRAGNAEKQAAELLAEIQPRTLTRDHSLSAIHLVCPDTECIFGHTSATLKVSFYVKRYGARCSGQLRCPIGYLETAAVPRTWKLDESLRSA
jgi:hypothetical protein